MRRALPRLFLALAASGAVLQACDTVEVVTPPPPNVSVTPSVVTIDVGERTRLTALVSGGSGGGVTWSSSAPEIVSVDNNGEIVGLAVGSATITARSGGGTGSAQVTVQRPELVVLDRPSLSFTAAPGGVAGPETVRITAPAAEVMTGLVVTVAYAAGGPTGWLRTALSSTSTPASLLISADARALAVGSYSATVDISADGVAGAQSIDVTLRVVGAPPTIALATDSVAFAANEAGVDPGPQQIAVANSGTGTLGQLAVSPVTYDSGQPSGWLTATLSAATAPATLVLDASVATLVQGVYGATVQVLSPDAANSPRTVRVTFTVTPPLPIIALNPTTLAFSAVQGGPPPPDQSVSVTNGGAGVLSGIATDQIYATGGTWLNSLALAPTAPTSVTVSIDPTGLAAGQHNAFVRVRAPGAANSPVLVPVTLTVTDPPIIALSHPTVIFTAVAGTGDPATENVIVTNVGGSVLDGLAVDSIQYLTGQRTGWLSAALSFPLAPSTLSLDATLNPPGGPLAPGTYDATVFVGSTAAGVTNSPQALPVTFFVTNTDPVATIGSPNDGDIFTAGASILFSGAATDAEDGALTGSSLSWASDLDGALGTGGSLALSTLTLGAHTITLTATDSQGATGTAAITVVVDSRPTATILTPADSAVFDEGTPIPFSGSASDPEDGALTGASLVWTSSQDGPMGTGASLPFAGLSTGFHTVSLIATDSQGAQDTATVVVRVNALPTADAGLDQVVADADGSGDEDVVLDGSGSSDAEGPLVAYDWSAAGVSIASGVTPTVTLGVGAHAIVLTVTDTDGAQDVDTVLVTVGANVAPTAQISAPLPGDVFDEGATVVLDGSATDPEDGVLSGSSLIWASDVDGFVGSGPTVQLTSLTPGPHTLSLSATDAAGAVGVATVAIRVNALPVANAGPDQPAVADADNSGDEVITLDGTASTDLEGPLSRFDWTTNAAAIPSGATPAVTLPVGQHVITLQVTDSDGATDTDDVVVTIGPNSGPSAAITAPADGSVYQPGDRILFSGRGSDPEDGVLTGPSLQWTSDVDGPIGTGPNVSTTSLSPATHTITLTATDSGGFTGSAAITVRVNAVPIASAGADVQVVDADGTGAETVVLDGFASSDADGSIVSYVWTDGATTAGTGPAPTVSLGVGVHTLTLTVTDNDGATATDDVVVTVTGNTAPTAAIQSPQTGQVFPLGAVVSLRGVGSDVEDGSISGAGLAWSSSLDGVLGVGGSISAPSLSVGTHVLTLTATDAGGLTGSASVSIRINAPPTADAGPDQTVSDADGSGDEPVGLDGSASSDPEGPVAAWAWALGGTTIASGANPVVTLPLGVHAITLTVTDTDGSTDTDNVTVTIGGNTAPTAAIQSPASGSVFLLGAPVTFAGSASDPEDGVLGGGALAWSSDVDGPIGSGTGFATTALSAGAHLVTLTATDRGGLTASDAISIRVNAPPTAAAGPDQLLTDADGSGDEAVTLDGSGSSDPEGPLASYVWTNATGGVVAIGANPTVSLPVAGSPHALTLTVTDADGAQATDGIVVTIAGNSVPSVSISSPADGARFDRGSPVGFVGTATDPEDGPLSGPALVWTSSLNGLLGTGTNLTTSALSAGTHVISLTATDAGGASAVASIGVVVNALPTANAGPDQRVTDADGSGDELVALHGSGSSDPEGPLVSFVWSEGGVQLATGVSPSTTLGVGVHTITLTVTDSDGATDTDDVVVTVGANTAPTASISAPQDGSVFQPGASVTLTGSGSDPEDGALTGASLAWDSSVDGALGTGASITTSGLSIGTHQLTLTAIDTGGLTGAASVTIRVNAPPVADAGPDQSVVDADGSGDEAVTLDGSASTDSDGSVSSYLWESGGAPIGTGVTPAVTLAVGVHTVTLTVTDDDGATATDDLTVTVSGNTPPTASITGPPDGSVFLEGSPVTLQGSGVDPQEGALTAGSLLWSSDVDGVLGTGGSLTISTLSPGPHTITLTATDGGGLSGTDAIGIRINSPPTADAGPDQNVPDADGSGDEAVTLDGSASTDAEGALASYAWSEGGVPVATGATPTVTLAVGVHTLTLTVTDGDGATASDDVVVTVVANTAPVATITAPADGSVTGFGASVTFQGTGVDNEDGGLGGAALAWTSDVDGPLGSGTSLTTSALSAGTHVITLTATDSAGLTGSDAITIRVNAAPVASAGVDQNLTDGDGSGDESVALDGTASTDPDGTVVSWDWTAPGVTIPSGATPTATFPVGVHTVTLTVTDNDGATATDGVVVTVGPNSAPTATVTDPPDGTVVASGTRVTFRGTGSDPEDGTISGGGLVWSSSLDGPLGFGPVLATSTLSTGLHTVTLTATDAGGLTGTDAITLRVNVPPTADAGPDQNLTDGDGSGDESVTLDGTLSSDPDGTVVSWVWEESGVQIATGSNPTVTLAVGVHTITLTVTDNDGGTATDDVVVTVGGNQAPVAAVTAPTTGSVVQPGANVVFQGTGTDAEDGALSGPSLVWTSDLDGPLGTGVSVSTTALSIGTHTVTLTATDSGGLTGADQITVRVNAPPTAAAGGDQSLTDSDGSGDEPVTLDGTLSSDPDGSVVSWVWTAPGVTIPSGATPTATFPVGVHTVTLTVTDNDGATATDDVVITVAAGNQSPVANAGPDQNVNDGDASGDEAVTLDGTLSSDPDGTVVSWDWTATGVTIPSGVTPTATFPVGVHTVTLTVTDNDGATATDDVVVTVGSNQAPVTTITAPADGSVFQPGASVSLQGSANDAEDGALTGASLAWASSLDGALGTGTPLVISTLSIGTHTITLTATDSGGATGADAITVRINAAPTANAGPDQNLTDVDLSGDEAVTLDGTASTDPDGTVVSWDWAAPGVTIPSGATPTATFPVGVHTVTLTVTDDDGGTDTDDVVITVTAGNQSPVANAGPDQPSVTDGDASGDAQVTLDGTGSTDPDGTVVSWDWTAPGVTIPSGATPVATFPVGVHTVTLTVTDDDGATDTDDVVITVLANQDPVANAGADQNVTDVDLSGDEAVTLDGTASADPDGTVVSWDWTATGVTIPSGATPTATFPVGVHTVTLTVTDNAGATATDDVVITVAAGNQSPVANAGPDQNLTDVDLSGDEAVTLDGTASTDPDGTVVSWDWTAPGVTIPSGATPTATFPVGVHTVTLTVTDDDGGTDTDDVVITVTAGNQSPVANAGPDQPSVTDGDASGDAQVTLDGTGSTDPDGTVVSWDWTAPGVTIPSGATPVATFPVGVHTVTLTVTDDDGATDTDDVVITVLANQDPVANAGADQNVTDVDLSGDEAVTLDGTASADPDGTVVSWDWTATGVTIPSGATPTATFPVGVHTVTLTVTDNAGATATDDVVITVAAGNQSPVANAGPDQNLTDVDLSGDEAVTLDGTASTDPDGTVVSWDWAAPGVTIPSGATPTATFPVGVHTVTLTVTDDDGGTDTDDVVITVTAGNQSPVANAGPDQPSVTDGDASGDAQVTLDGTGSTDPDGTVVSWDWTAPGVTIPSGATPVATFPVGVHTVTLTVTDDDGATDTDDVVITVLANQDPVANAGADQNVTDVDLSGDEAVTLDGTASADPDGTVVSWDWTATGVTIPSGATPTATFPVGVHTVTLTVTDNAGATATDDVVITVAAGNQSPVANAGPDQNLTDVDLSGDEAVTLDGTASTDPDGTVVSWDWAAPGVTIPSGATPTATFPVGVHTVTLTVTDDDGGTDTDDVVITVTAGNQSPVANAGPDQPSVTDGDASGDAQVTLDGTGSTDPDGTVVSWDWTAPGVTIPSGATPVATFPVGVHTVTLTVTDDDGATDTDDVVITVLANQDPVANAGPDQPSVTDPDGSGDEAVTLDGSSSADPDGTVVSWDWTATGVTIPSGATPTATFPVGVHTVTLTVTDNGGATATDDVVVTVLANTAPTASITSPADGSSFASGANVTFTGTGTDPEEGALTGASLVWTSDLDGSIGSGGTVQTTTLSVGTHTITLTATDAGGLIGTAVITVTIT